MSDCIFCKIVKGEIPSEKIYEDEYTFAFLDIHPNNLGHTLVVTKDHFENIYTTPDEEFCRLMLTVKKMATAIKHGLDADGINIVMNNEKAGGQDVFHTHIHVIPRFSNDGGYHGRHLIYKEGESKAVSAKIKKELEK